MRVMQSGTELIGSFRPEETLCRVLDGSFLDWSIIDIQRIVRWLMDLRPLY